jgi:predicted SAM-dependent methyltransferase
MIGKWVLNKEKLSVEQVENNCVKINDSDLDILQRLKAQGLWKEGKALRLHLGCGHRYINGYINIDYPPSEHNLAPAKADVYADIRSLDFPARSVDEIRLHHVFEHFSRVVALGMLIKWHKWLKIGGKLHIETPDLIGSAKTLISNASWQTKMGVVRHLAGDQTANWGYHLDHWFAERFEHTLGSLGFELIQTLSSSWSREPYLSNVEVVAIKSKQVCLQEQLKVAEELLWESTVALEEKAKWDVWKKDLYAILSGHSIASPSNAHTPDISTISEILDMLFRDNAQIPLDEIHNFNQRSRDRWVITKANTIPARSRVLDVGAGTCPYRQFFSHCDYKTQDFKKYKGIKKNKTTEYGKIDYVSDVANIPVPDESFDVIVCTEVLEHVPEPIEALRELSRILRPSGRLLITAPLGSGLHLMPYHYYGGYTPQWFKHFLPKFGLKVNEISPNGGFFKLLAQECARVAWTFPQHRHLHGNNVQFIWRLFNEWLPRYLFALDEQCFIDQFTVGYHVEAEKLPVSTFSKTDMCQPVGHII